MPKQILLSIISGRLSRLPNLSGPVYVVGGLVSEGYSYRDIDIIINNIKDVGKIKKALGPYKGQVHFLIKKGKPSSRIYLIIDKILPKSRQRLTDSNKTPYSLKR